jgi:hypothetical protein
MKWDANTSKHAGLLRLASGNPRRQGQGHHRHADHGRACSAVRESREHRKAHGGCQGERPRVFEHHCVCVASVVKRAHLCGVLTQFHGTFCGRRRPLRTYRLGARPEETRNFLCKSAFPLR